MGTADVSSIKISVKGGTGTMKKFKLIKEQTISFRSRTLFRIKACVSFGDIRKGDVGGYIERADNLSVSGNAWVYGNARVSGNAEVYGDAEVSGNARVSGNAEVYGDARVYGDAEVSGNARVYGNAEVSGNARVSGDAWVYGDAWVFRFTAIVNLIGACSFNVTAYNKFLKIGCEFHTFAEWHSKWSEIMQKHNVTVCDEAKYRAALEYCEAVIRREILFRQF